MKTPIPVDTIIDSQPDMSDDAKTLLKAVYLEFSDKMGGVEGLSATQIINSFEELRKAGFIELITNRRGDIGVRFKDMEP